MAIHNYTTAANLSVLIPNLFLMVEPYIGKFREQEKILSRVSFESFYILLLQIRLLLSSSLFGSLLKSFENVAPFSNDDTASDNLSVLRRYFDAVSAAAVTIEERVLSDIQGQIELDQPDMPRIHLRKALDLCNFCPTFGNATRSLSTAFRKRIFSF